MISLAFATTSCLTRTIRIPSPPEQLPPQRPSSCTGLTLRTDPPWSASVVPPGHWQRVDATGAVTDDMTIVDESYVVRAAVVRADALWHGDVGAFSARVHSCDASLPGEPTP